MYYKACHHCPLNFQFSTPFLRILCCKNINFCARQNLLMCGIVDVEDLSIELVRGHCVSCVVYR